MADIKRRQQGKRKFKSPEKKKKSQLDHLISSTKDDEASDISDVDDTLLIPSQTIKTSLFTPKKLDNSLLNSSQIPSTSSSSQRLSKLSKGHSKSKLTNADTANTSKESIDELLPHSGPNNNNLNQGLNQSLSCGNLSNDEVRNGSSKVVVKSEPPEQNSSVASDFSSVHFKEEPLFMDEEPLFDEDLDMIQDIEEEYIHSAQKAPAKLKSSSRDYIVNGATETLTAQNNSTETPNAIPSIFDNYLSPDAIEESDIDDEEIIAAFSSPNATQYFNDDNNVSPAPQPTTKKKCLSDLDDPLGVTQIFADPDSSDEGDSNDSYSLLDSRHGQISE